MTFLDESKLLHFQRIGGISRHTILGSTTGLYRAWSLGEAIWKISPTQQEEQQIRFGTPLPFLPKLNFFALYSGASHFPHRNRQVKVCKLMKIIALQKDSVTLRTVNFCQFGVSHPHTPVFSPLIVIEVFPVYISSSLTNLLNKLLEYNSTAPTIMPFARHWTSKAIN